MSDASVRGVDGGLTAYGDVGFSAFLRRAFLASAGLDAEDLGRPVVGIADTSSDYTTCHREMPQLVDSVKRGVLEAGGLPFVFPTMSLPEILVSPTSMLFRNLMAMETEELITAQPMDGVVLLGGCDKTVPAQLMAAISADVPAVQVVAGPMLTSSWRGERLGACTDCRGMWARHRAGDLDEADVADVQTSLATTGGTCMVMGTASTMACLAEALGLSPAGTATAPAASGDRLRAGVVAGRLAVAATRRDLRPSELLSLGSMLNAVTVLMAVGGSTNAIIHLLAIARRAGLELTLDDIDEMARRVPLHRGLQAFGHRLSRGLAPRRRRACADEDTRALPGPVRPGHRGRHTARTGSRVSPRLRTWQTVIRPLERPLGPTAGARGVAGKPRAGRSRHQTLRSDPRTNQARGPSGGVRVSGRRRSADRRPDPGDLGGLGARSPQCRSGGLGDARGRLVPSAQEARGARGPGHGPHLRCADERHVLRHRRASRRARGRSGRTTRFGPGRRHDPLGRRRRGVDAPRRRRRTRNADAPLDAATVAGPWLASASRRSMSFRHRKAPTLTSSARPRKPLRGPERTERMIDRTGARSGTMATDGSEAQSTGERTVTRCRSARLRAGHSGDAGPTRRRHGGHCRGAHLGLDKGNVHRLLRMLEERGYVEQDQATKAYRASVQLVSLAGHLLRGHGRRRRGPAGHARTIDRDAEKRFTWPGAPSPAASTWRRSARGRHRHRGDRDRRPATHPCHGHGQGALLHGDNGTSLGGVVEEPLTSAHDSDHHVAGGTDGRP